MVSELNSTAWYGIIVSEDWCTTRHYYNVFSDFGNMLQLVGIFNLWGKINEFVKK
jgi:hypothetical protein